MIIYIITDINRLFTYNLPIKTEGNYWINYTNRESEKVNLLNISENNNEWVIKVNEGFQLYNKGEEADKCILKANSFYFVKDLFNDSLITVFCSNVKDDLQYYDISNVKEVIIGNAPNCNIFYNNTLIASNQAKIIDNSKERLITNLALEKANVFVNKYAIEADFHVHHGDVIFILGLKMIILGNILIINNPANSVTVNLPVYDKNLLLDDTPEVTDDDSNVTVYTKKDYFNRSPRFRSKIDTLEIDVDDPPSKEKEDDTPAILTVGPMLTMGMTSVVMLFTSVNNAVKNQTGIISVLPQMVMAIAMLGTMVFWPSITRKFKAKQRDAHERKRRDKYEVYIQSLRQKIVNNITKQRQILMENHISINDCVQIILNRSTRLWERIMEEPDFLVVRLGLGIVPLDIDIQYKKENFVLEDDILKDIVQNLVDEAHDISGAPITVSLLQKNITGIVGEYDITANFLKGILLQLLTFYSADLLKIVILTNEANEHNWIWVKELQHCWDNEQENRFFASSSDDVKDVIRLLDKEYDLRVENDSDNNTTDANYANYAPYYVIICDDYKMISDNSFIKKLLASNENYGFSILIYSDMISALPNQVSCFININQDVSGVIEKELSTNTQKEFMMEVPTNDDIEKCARVLANIPVLSTSKSKGLPESCGLLEMYNVGKVEGLNSSSRWAQNDPTVSLAAPIGIDSNGDLFKLDLHEKFHGPHGLIAGMTGSGKSEFIITLVLSLAINYHPNEVAFVLIDYKGGGLALAFENKELGIRLPHIAGTITNLDVTELNRALASIEAELKRRQREFNNARDISGESTIDIYKYQRLYREGIVKKPIPHLFLISDEFAELKAQQPEFMDQLISTARIGRSLGVHLILATQKPAGVVNDQIWSNAKFKICLKVQDQADSKDMIRVPDAAELKQVGRFYLLVGYNDYFAIGQSAYCGMPYIPSDVIKKSVDTSLNFVNNVGYVIKSIDDFKTVDTEAQGEVLLNVVKYISALAQEQNVVVDRLWLDRIPNIIYVSDLITKYKYHKEDYVINPVIGEYDDPSRQMQGLVTLPLTELGNTLIFGMTGSGKEDLLATLIYSCITTYTTSEINFYIIDCGSETLKMFAKAPQVGDVMLISEGEKIANCFKLLMDEFTERKKILADYNGDIKVYNSMSANKKPYIISIINNFDNFLESYANLEDIVAKLSREGMKYGILFIIAGNATNSVRFKLRQNFLNTVCLRLMDSYDYNDAFNTRNKVIPSENKGRGLIKKDEVYEFQSASICPEENKLEFIKNLCNKLNEGIALKAPKVPILPEHANIEYFENETLNLEALPIGVEKETLKTSTFNFKEYPISVVSTSLAKNLTSFANGLLQMLVKVNNTKIIVLDAINFYKTRVNQVTYYTENYDNVITNLNNLIETNLETRNISENIVLVITGLNDLVSNLDIGIKKKFTDNVKLLKNLPFIRIIVMDAIDSIKTFNYEDWFKSSTNLSYGIWIGNGINDQTTIKATGNFRQLSAEIKNDMGYVIIETTPILAKLLEYTEEDTEKVEVL